MKIGKKFFLGILILVILILTAEFAPLFLGRSERVPHEELKSYIEEYLSEYRRLVEENMGLLNGAEDSQLGPFTILVSNSHFHSR